MPIKIDNIILRAKQNGDELFFDETDGLEAKKDWKVYFYHVASGWGVTFKAFLTAFSDNYTQNWQSEDVYGRMDPIQRYQNTRRTITLGIAVPSYNEINAFKNFSDASVFAKMQYPSYSDSKAWATTIASPPLVKVKMGNLIIQPNGDPAGTAIDSGLLCSLDGFKMTPNLEMGFYDSEPGVLIPKEFGVDVELTVLHTHKLGFKSGGGSTSHADINSESENFPYNLNEIRDVAATKNRTVSNVESDSLAKVTSYGNMTDEEKKRIQEDTDRRNRDILERDKEAAEEIILLSEED